nr:hypothetical protein [Tanacetum cinerariifolium]
DTLQEVIEVVTATKLMTEVVTAATTTITAAAPITATTITAKRRKGGSDKRPRRDCYSINHYTF